ncbi:MAG: CopG domain protein DNA-binding domain protein [Acidobacteriales bacterium]|nr:CopG domain protein DNA-binding domain protein [Terriglobales bacterium]
MSTTLSVRVDPELEAQLSDLAQATDRPKSWHLEQALKNYLEMQAWQIAHIRKAIQAADSGDLVSHDQVLRTVRKRISRSTKKPA